MAVNRVDFGGNTLIDLTGDTLELPEQLLKGIIAHCKDGTPIEGTLEAGGGEGGGSTTPSAKWNDVTFIDYDGSVLYSYSLAEAKALTELPPLPAHDGLICQGWNWSLESIQALNRPVTVGAMYITDDGATRLHIRIATIGRMDVPLYIGQTVANGVTIDWGDGSDAQTLAGTGDVNTTHTYAEPGDYTISLMPEDGCTLSFGAGSSGYCVLGLTESRGNVYCSMIQSVSVGRNVATIGKYAFYNCHSLESITIPSSVYYIEESAFAYCYSLESLIIPYGVYYIGKYAISCCFSLTIIAISSSVFDISSDAFYSNYSLTTITIPSGVKNIRDYTFGYCNGMRYYNFSAYKSIPTLSSLAFYGIRSDCQMLIPAALYDEWSTATNWAAYAKYMVAV